MLKRVLCAVNIITAWNICQASASCVTGVNLQNAGGSCDFDSNTPILCDWVKPEGHNLTWKADFDDVFLSQCISTNTADLNINQIVRLRSPLLCPTNSTFFTYTLTFYYSMYHSDRCRFSVSITSPSGDKITEVWNTQQTTFDPRSRGWKTAALSIDHTTGEFYIVFAAERISPTETVVLSLDTVTFTTQIITTTTTTTTPTSTTTPPSTTTVLTTTLLPTTTTLPPTTTTTTTTTTPTTTSTTPTTTTSTTTRPTTTSTTTTTTTPRPTTTAKPTTTTMKTNSGSSLNQGDGTIIWGLTLDYLIAIGVGAFVLIVLIIIIACCCRRKKPPPQDVHTVSFSLQNPTAYDVNKKKKPKSKRPLESSKKKVWEPDMTLY